MSGDAGLGRAEFGSSEGRSCLNYGLDTSMLDSRTASHSRGTATVHVGKALISQGPPLEIEETGHPFEKVALAFRREAFVAQLCSTLVTPWPLTRWLLCPWDSPGKNTGVSCHFLLQGNLLTQGSNAGPLCWQVGSLPSEPPGKPSIPFFK